MTLTYGGPSLAMNDDIFCSGYEDVSAFPDQGTVGSTVQWLLGSPIFNTLTWLERQAVETATKHPGRLTPHQVQLCYDLTTEHGHLTP